MFCEECQSGGDAAGPERHCFIIRERPDGRWGIFTDVTAISGHNQSIQHIRAPPPERSLDDLKQMSSEIFVSRLDELNEAPGVADIALVYLEHIIQLMMAKK